jgi:hypothetical protein
MDKSRRLALLLATSAVLIAGCGSSSPTASQPRSIPTGPAAAKAEATACERQFADKSNSIDPAVAADLGAVCTDLSERKMSAAKAAAKRFCASYATKTDEGLPTPAVVAACKSVE